MIKSKAKVSLLFHSDHASGIRIEDATSGEIVAHVHMNPSDVVRLLSREVMVECDVEYGELSRVGKNMEIEKLVFPMPDGIGYKERNKVAIAESVKHVPDGWVADNYYGGQSSFFEVDGQKHARVTIRRWVSELEAGE